MNFNTPPIVKNLLIINLLVFLMQAVSPVGDEMITWFGQHSWRSDDFRPYQLFTSIFLHGGISHLFTNMFALWMFGRILEYDLGAKRFLTYYLVTGIGAGIFNQLIGEIGYQQTLIAVNDFVANATPSAFSALTANHLEGFSVNQEFLDAWRATPSNEAYISQAIKGAYDMLAESSNQVTVGASGAVFGVLLAFGMLHPNDVIMLLIPPMPIKAKYFVMIYGAVELFMGVTGTMNGISHFSHIGGMVWGFLLLRWWRQRR